MKVYPTGMLFVPINDNEDRKSGWCKFCYFFAIILGANSLCFWKSAVKTLIYMKVWKTKCPIFGSIRLKMSEPVTYYPDSNEAKGRKINILAYPTGISVNPNGARKCRLT